TGYLTLFPGAAIPQTSTTSYRMGRTRANFTIAPLAPAGALNVFNGSMATQHVLLDVTGYFE
ncbi:MAG TPA: hypothetical protein VF608_13335, partial [Thermoanaerobaculia bacterium]